MVLTKTIDVSHWGGITVGYKLSEPFNNANPTVVMTNSYTTSSELYASWFDKQELVSKINLLAVEPLGHGKTRAKTDNWTYWNSAWMVLEVLQALNIEQAYFGGTSQGGFIATRMALLAPQKNLGLILLGTCMDREGPELVQNGCWDGLEMLNQMLTFFSTAQENFQVPQSMTEQLLTMSIGPNLTPEISKTLTKIHEVDYAGPDGQKRIRMATINLRDRDSIVTRLPDITCRVLWMQGTADPVYSVQQAKKEIELFINAKSKVFKVVENGGHFLSITNPDEVEEAMLEFVSSQA